MFIIASITCRWNIPCVDLAAGAPLGKQASRHCVVHNLRPRASFGRWMHRTCRFHPDVRHLGVLLDDLDQGQRFHLVRLATVPLGVRDATAPQGGHPAESRTYVRRHGQMRPLL